MFPLKERYIAGYRQGQRTFYGVKHKGNDYRANYINLYAPFDGKIVGIPNEPLGGQWLQYRDNEGRTHHFAHMSSVKRVGSYKRGQIIGKTGNSGRLTTNPHLHYHIWKNNILIDPETIYKRGETMTPAEKKELKRIAKDLSHTVHVRINKELISMIGGNADRIIKLEKETVRLDKKIDDLREDTSDIIHIRINKEIVGEINGLKKEIAKLKKTKGHTADESQAITFIGKKWNEFKNWLK